MDTPENISNQKTFKINYFSPEEKKALERKGYIIDPAEQAKKDTEIDQSYKNIYEKTKKLYEISNEDDNNYIKAKKYYSQRPETVLLDKLGTRVNKDGWEFLQLPESTTLYKGMRYFYKGMPDKMIWVGDKEVAIKFAERYCGGINVYNTKKEFQFLVLNEHNLTKIWNEAPDEMKEDISVVYGINTTIEKQTERTCRVHPSWCENLWLYDENECIIPNPAKLQHLPANDEAVRFHKYIFEKYKFDGTFLEYYITPFENWNHDEEICLNLLKIKDDIELLHDNNLSWETWGLDLIDESKFLFNERYPVNRGFRIVNWYKLPDLNNIPVADPDKTSILTFNVNGLISANALHEPEKVLELLCKLLGKIKSNIVILQEFPNNYLQKIKSIGYKVIHTVNPQKYLSLVVLTDEFCKFEIIEDRQRTVRNSILFYYKSAKIVATHLEIGYKYESARRFLEYSEFMHNYKRNVEMRTSQLKKILTKSPDFIVGDFNFGLDDTEMELFKDYHQGLSTVPTSIYGNKVDWVMSKNKVSADEQVIQYSESDHKPLLFSFKAENIKGGYDGFSGYNSQILDIKPFIFLMIITLLIIILVWYLVSKKINSGCSDCSVDIGGQHVLDGSSSLDKYLELSPA